MPQFSTEEIRETYERYVTTRTRAENGEVGWDALAEFFTEDAVFIDPAWGRSVGRAQITAFFAASMAGLEGWTFPHLFAAIEGDLLITGWKNRFPGERADGRPYEATGVSILRYAGNGQFSFEEDVLNMVHVNELMRESHWRPGPDIHVPPNPVPR